MAARRFSREGHRGFTLIELTLTTVIVVPDWMLPAVRLLGDLGVARGGSPPDRAQRKRIEFADVDLPVDLGTWRSLGAAPNSFVIESAIDELARLRGVDPVELRLLNIAPEHERLVACLRRTRELAEGRPLPAGSSVGRGYACGIYEEHSFVAAGADVRVDESTGAVQVSRMCCVQDVGLAVNPDQLRAQIEGNNNQCFASYFFRMEEMTGNLNS